MDHFDKLGLSRPVVEAVRKMGFETPTPIQALVIPKLLNQKNDLIALAQTGTGKTAAFGLPLVESIDTKAWYPQVLVLAPTRELALQITGDLESFSRNIHQLNILTVYGGTDIRRQIRALQKGVQLIVATPGRLKDLMGRREVDLSRLHTVVLDEADEMLNMGFRPDLERILAATPDTKQTWLFSATMSNDVQKLSGRYLRNPLEVSAGERNVTNEDIDHQYIMVETKAQKYKTLLSLLDQEEDFYGLLFCRTRHETRKLAQKLSKENHAADALHGDMSQRQRERVMNRFRDRKLRVLVATDVAARGLDIDDLTHVLHYNMPDDLAFYTHRSGRTGRAGKQGTSLALLSPGDMSQLRQIERRSKVKFQRVEVGAVREPRRNGSITPSLSDLVRSVHVPDHLLPLLPELERELKDLSREELIARLAALIAPKVARAKVGPSQEERTPSRRDDDGEGKRHRSYSQKRKGKKQHRKGRSPRHNRA